jgi:hypothetical protein
LRILRRGTYEDVAWLDFVRFALEPFWNESLMDMTFQLFTS